MLSLFCCKWPLRCFDFHNAVFPSVVATVIQQCSRRGRVGVEKRRKWCGYLGRVLRIKEHTLRSMSAVYESGQAYVAVHNHTQVSECSWKAMWVSPDGSVYWRFIMVSSFQKWINSNLLALCQNMKSTENCDGGSERLNFVSVVGNRSRLAWINGWRNEPRARTTASKNMHCGKENSEPIPIAL